MIQKLRKLWVVVWTMQVSNTYLYHNLPWKNVTENMLKKFAEDVDKISLCGSTRILQPHCCLIASENFFLWLYTIISISSGSCFLEIKWKIGICSKSWKSRLLVWKMDGKVLQCKGWAFRDACIAALRPPMQGEKEKKSRKWTMRRVCMKEFLTIGGAADSTLTVNFLILNYN